MAMTVTEITGEDLIKMLDLIGEVDKARDQIWELRVGIDVDGAKLSINGSVWTPGYGRRTA